MQRTTKEEEKTPVILQQGPKKPLPGIVILLIVMGALALGYGIYFTVFKGSKGTPKSRFTFSKRTRRLGQRDIPASVWLGTGIF